MLKLNPILTAWLSPEPSTECKSLPKHRKEWQHTKAGLPFTRVSSNTSTQIHSISGIVTKHYKVCCNPANKLGSRVTRSIATPRPLPLPRGRQCRTNRCTRGLKQSHVRFYPTVAIYTTPRQRERETKQISIFRNTRALAQRSGFLRAKRNSRLLATYARNLMTGTLCIAIQTRAKKALPSPFLPPRVRGGL